MSASLDVDVLLLASELSRLPADRLVALKRIAVKMEGGFLDVDDLAAMVEGIQDGVRTYDDGLAVLAAAH